MSFEPPPLPPQYGALQVWWEAVRAGWKAQFDAQQAAIDALAAAVAAQADATAALANAATAQTTATTAQTTADTVKTTDKISGSSVVPANVLSATDAGSNATVTVAAHTRLYGNASTLAVSGTSFTGKAYSTKYAVYYDDPTCADTTPPYQITTTISNAVANFASGRHFVGIVTTPAAAGAPTSGGVTAGGMDPADRPDMSTL